MGAYVNPTDHEETTLWANEASAYDGNPGFPTTGGTYAYASVFPLSWSPYITFLFAGGITGTSIRFLSNAAYPGISYVQVQLFYDNVWNNFAADGTEWFTYDVWRVISFTSATYTKVRIRFLKNVNAQLPASCRLHAIQLSDDSLTSTSTSTTSTSTTSTSTSTTMTTTSTSTSTLSSTSTSITSTSTSTSSTSTSTTSTSTSTTSTSTTSTSTTTTLVVTPLPQAGVATSLVPKIIIDGNSYWYEKGTYSEHNVKAVTDQIASDGTFRRVEGGLDATIWRMNIFCSNRDELNSLSGSFVSTTPVVMSPTYNQLGFTDNRGASFTVYFDTMGPIDEIDRASTMFRVPIKLVETAV